ncbi:TPA: hypothetical protein DCZ31_00855 [Patescibacteria group bacterium]|nr:hypothetical protein [Candidatus Gracilibacteria bacterium]
MLIEKNQVFLCMFLLDLHILHEFLVIIIHLISGKILLLILKIFQSDLINDYELLINKLKLFLKIEKEF